MKDKDIIESYLKNLKEELIMYSDSLSDKNLDYISKLKKSYNKWEKDLDKLNGVYVKKSIKQEIETTNDTTVDDTLYQMVDEYLAYLDYKDDYLKTGSKEKLDMSHTELSHFLTLLTDMFNEISESSKDNMDERNMIKSTIKSIYQKL